MSTDTVALGRLIVFLVVKAFRVLGLKAKASVRDADESLKKLTQEIKDSALSESEKTARLTEVSEAHKSALGYISGPLKPATKEAADDFERFLDAYTIYMGGKTDEERESLKKHSEEVQLSFFDMDYAMKPMVYGNVQVRLREGLLTSWVILLVGIPVLVVLWNLHPVLGILGIIGYVFILWKRKEAGQF